MSTPSEKVEDGRSGRTRPEPGFAATMTRAASKQTYYTIRFLADRSRREDAYRAYAYFRWVDDRLDDDPGSPAARRQFLERQQALLDAGYRGEMPGDLRPEEQLLAELIAQDDEPDSGLQSYLRHMMAVMAFDVGRRGRTITQAEAATYTRHLTTAVTDALYHFIGHDEQPPRDEERYQAVEGAHIIHMLRDAVEDTAAGYYNIPREVLAAGGIGTDDLDAPAYREWVARRVQCAGSCFQVGREYIRQVRNRRCRLAGYAYIARFEWVARVIARDNYRLREDYPERKTLRAATWMGWQVISQTFLPGGESHGNAKTV